MRPDPSAGARLRTLMDRGVVAAPGAFCALVGRAVAAAGFDACYVSGGALSAASGVPDIGLRGLDHFTAVIREVVTGSGLPALADADTGFGEEEMVRRTVLEYARAGAAGLHLEDQVFPKRCGHLDGKALLPVEQAASKVAWAAKAARESVDPAFVVCARTDAAGVEGLEAAIARAKAYVEAGAEMIFPEGLRSEAEFGRFAEAMKSAMSPKRERGAERPVADARGSSKAPYLLANMTEFGKTPMIPLKRFGELGYDLVIYPVSTLRLAMGAIVPALAELRERGTLEGRLDAMQTREALYGLLGYTPGKAWEMPGR